jgi:hypothetical protein
VSIIGTATGAQSKSNPALNADTVEGLEKIYDEGRSGDWKTRFTALQSLVTFAQENERAFKDQSQATQCIDLFVDRPQDGNVKVNQLAISCLNEMIPILKVIDYKIYCSSGKLTIQI